MHNKNANFTVLVYDVTN